MHVDARHRHAQDQHGHQPVQVGLLRGHIARELHAAFIELAPQVGRSAAGQQGHVGGQHLVLCHQVEDGAVIEAMLRGLKDRLAQLLHIGVERIALGLHQRVDRAIEPRLRHLAEQLVEPAHAVGQLHHVQPPLADVIGDGDQARIAADHLALLHHARAGNELLHLHAGQLLQGLVGAAQALQGQGKHHGNAHGQNHQHQQDARGHRHRKAALVRCGLRGRRCWW